MIQRTWNLRMLLFCHILIALLAGTLFWPITKGFWESIDLFTFKLLNGSLQGRPHWQIFWALSNHKLADWIEDIFILGFFIAYVRQFPKGSRMKPIAQLFFCTLYIAAIIYFINRMLFREWLMIPRASPTLLVDSSIHLSQEIPWLKIKDDSSKSFPGDHGTTALLFAAIYTYLAGWRLGLLASLYAVFLCLPRLITGAHWFSDVFVGSGTITLFFLSWAFCTPIGSKAVDGIERFFWLIRKSGNFLFLRRQR